MGVRRLGVITTEADDRKAVITFVVPAMQAIVIDDDLTLMTDTEIVEIVGRITVSQN